MSSQRSALIGGNGVWYRRYTERCAELTRRGCFIVSASIAEIEAWCWVSLGRIRGWVDHVVGSKSLDFGKSITYRGRARAISMMWIASYAWYEQLSLRS